jgi:hypothetical protein
MTQKEDRKRLLWGALFIFVVSLAIRCTSFQGAFDSSDKIMHPLAGMNLTPLPWFTQTLRHSKLAGILTYPYGLVIFYYYAWLHVLDSLGIPITETSITFFTALLGAIVPTLAYVFFAKRGALRTALLAALAVSVAHINVFRSISAASVVLTQGAIGILAVLICLQAYLSKPSRRRALALVAVIALHFVSCQTAILLIPIWLFPLVYYRRKLPSNLTIYRGLGLFVVLMASVYAAAYLATRNRFVTAVGKLFSKGLGSDFDAGAAFRDYFSGMGYFSTAFCVAALILIATRWKKLDLKGWQLVAASLAYFVPLFRLSKATIISAYAYESQFLLVLAGLYAVEKLPKWKNERNKQLAFAAVVAVFLIETSVSISRHWSPTIAELGLRREYDLRDSLSAKAAGSLIRRDYSTTVPVFTDIEPVLSHFYFGSASVLGINDGTASENQRYFKIVRDRKLARLAVISPETLLMPVDQAKNSYCIERIIEDAERKPVKLVLKLDKKGPCSPRLASVAALAHEFNLKYHTRANLLPEWIPFPPLDLKNTLQ